MKLFLEYGNANISLSDSKGQTPISFAASRGYGGVVKLLLECGMLILTRRIMMAEYPCYIRPRGC